MRTVLTLVLLTQFAAAAAQNLIPNPSFEDDCESGALGNGFFGAAHWYLPSLGTVDYWTVGETDQACYLNAINASAWVNFGEYVVPIDGERMIGGYTWHSAFCLREILQCRLTEDLLNGETYCFSMWVQRSNMYNFANDGLGMALSVDSIVDPESVCGLELTPLVQSFPGQAVIDTLNWTRIEGTFIAEGGERYLTIGNLLNDEQVAAVDAGGTLGTLTAYYYFDDLTLTSCGLSVSNTRSEKRLILRPNPATELVRVEGSEPHTLWEIYSLDGKKHLQGMGQQIDITSLEHGIYFVQIDGVTLRLICAPR